MQVKYIVGAVVVVGALFAFKVVKVGDLNKVQCRARQSEAKLQLEETRKRISAKAAKGEVVYTFKDLDWSPRTDTPRYQYTISTRPISLPCSAPSAAMRSSATKQPCCRSFTARTATLCCAPRSCACSGRMATSCAAVRI